jgi:predicted glycosyltransferase involved in capsule biosynthesis
LTHRGGLINTCLLSPLRRFWFRLRLLGTPDQPEVTVVIPVRNRIDVRIRNCLQSLREQDYPAEKIHILIVEYGSDEDADIPYLLSLCDKFDAHCHSTGPQDRWSRSHSVNVGLQRVETEIVMISDNDYVYGPDYIRKAVGVLVEKPLSVVYAPILDMPESCNEQLQAEKIDLDQKLPEWKQASSPRTPGLYHAGNLTTFTMFLRHLRGMDENFFGWGVEDNDIQERLYRLGTDKQTLEGVSYYLHQWHPRGQSYSPEEVSRYTQANWDYFTGNRSVRRNPHGWGMEKPLPSRDIYASNS